MLYLRSFNRFILISLAFLGLSVSSVQATVFTLAEGHAINSGTAFSHAQAGGRQALSLLYVSCSLSIDPCLAGATAEATNDYFWNVVAKPGFESKDVPLSVSYFLGVGSSNGGKAFATIAVQGNPAGSLFSSFGTYNQSGSVAAFGRAGTPFTISLDTSVNLSIGQVAPSSDVSSLVWALADPIVTIDPTWEFASNFSLEEVVNPMEISGFGILPANLDLGEIPTQLVMAPNAVPVPAAVWLFGTALIGLVGFSKRRKVA